MFWNLKAIKTTKISSPFEPKDTTEGPTRAYARAEPPQYRRHARLVIFTHWVFAAGVLILTLSGFYIGRQTGFRWMFSNIKQAQVAHFYAAFGATFAYLLRVGYAFKNGDWRHIAFTMEDFRKIPAMLAYTFFLRPTAPPYQKYNPIQKLVYTGWFFFYPIVALVGFGNYFQSRIPWVQRFLPLELIPAIKTYSAIFFLTTIILHIYLGLFDDFDLLRSIFTGHTRECQKADPLLTNKETCHGREAPAISPKKRK